MKQWYFCATPLHCHVLEHRNRGDWFSVLLQSGDYSSCIDDHYYIIKEGAGCVLHRVNNWDPIFFLHLNSRCMLLLIFNCLEGGGQISVFGFRPPWCTYDYFLSLAFVLSEEMSFFNQCIVLIYILFFWFFIYDMSCWIPITQSLIEKIYMCFSILWFET